MENTIYLIYNSGYGVGYLDTCTKDFHTAKKNADSFMEWNDASFLELIEKEKGFYKNAICFNQL